MKSDIPKITTIDQYIDAASEHARELLTQLRTTIARAAPEATEKISYGVPTFDFRGNLVHFAAFKHHIGFYPTPSGIDVFKDELKQYKVAKGSVQFPIDEPLPLDLVARIVQFRVKENAQSSTMPRTRA
jgi:uncharacterized protein YdhG (YjbR/CyaY superfamily)